MRRLLLILALVVSGLAVPARPADAMSAGPCVVSGAVAYQGLAPMVPPQFGGSALAMHLTLDCVGTGLFEGAGEGSTSGSCLQEIGSATLAGQSMSGTATWVRAGYAGWLVVTWLGPGPSSSYVYEGPFFWQPAAGDPSCLLGPAFGASMTSVGLHMGV